MIVKRREDEAKLEQHRSELKVHCYRMLGSLHDAEDAVQQTLLKAWQAFDGFRGESSIRTWLYQIATNECLNVLRSARRRPTRSWDISAYEPPPPTRLGEIPWLEPFPDSEAGPEVSYQRAQAISLSFIAALQTLPPRQVAVLILRDVLGFPASEVSTLLSSTVESVNSALKRARANLQTSGRDEAAQKFSTRDEEDALAAKFVSAYQAADLDALIALLSDDVFLAMPPFPFEYVGRDAVKDFMARLLGSGRRFELRPTRANGQPAFGAYLRTPAGICQGTGLIVLAVRRDRICELSHFESSLLPRFNLPATLPSPCT